MTVTTEGFEETDAKLANVENIGPRLVRPMEQSVDLAFVRVLLTTPVDTGQLKGSMDKAVEGMGNHVVGTVFSWGAFGPYGHRYDHYVKSDEHQAWMHRGRVATMGEDLEAVTPQIVPLFENTIELLLRS